MTEETKAYSLFWIDLEMTGLDEKKDKILEVAVVFTDLDFNTLDEYEAVVHQPQEVLDAMDEWCTKTHGESGLTEKVKSGVPLSTVEDEVVALVEKHFKEEKVVLCGNSVGQDRKFIDAYMPKLAAKLHYRIIDVSSFKEIFSRKFSVTFDKKEAHRAKDDILESIAELKHYLAKVPHDGQS